MVSEARRGFSSELRVSATPALLACSALALAGLIAFEDVMVRAWILLICAALIVAWFLITWMPSLGKGLAVAIELGVIELASLWSGIPELQALFVIPVLHAAGMLNLRAAVATACGATLLLLTRSEGGAASGAMRGVGCLLLWSTLGTLALVYHEFYRIVHWAWSYYSDAQDLVGQARYSIAMAKQALDDLSHANRQLALMNERLDACRLAAEEAQRSKAQFVAKVSHEFRTPLNIIIGLADFVLSNGDVYGERIPTAVVEDLRVIHHSCEHLSGMVNDVLDLSQAEAGRLVLYREHVDLRELIDEAMHIVLPLGKKKGLTLEVSFPEDVPLVYCDRTRIRQVMLNLVTNAARFTEEGWIKIDVAAEERYVVVSVADTGAGIPEDHLDTIFGAFSQVEDKPWRAREGTGLGLAVSRQFIEHHGGRIWVKSRVGVGSTFSFTIPTAPWPEHVSGPGRWLDATWPWVQRRSWAETDDSVRPRVLVCDGNGSLAAAFAHLSDQAELVSVRTLDEAVGQARDCPAHAVILGSPSPVELWPLIDEARSAIADTPIVGCVTLYEPRQGAESSVVDSLTKPVTRVQLEAALANLDRMPERVLVVDDDPELLRLWARILEGHDPAIEVVTAADGEQALEALHDSPPDLVLLDIVLPGMSGWQVLASKERDPGLRGIPVILVSAQDLGEQHAVDALVVTIEGGIPPSELLRYSLGMSSLMLGGDRAPNPASR
ncbi:MAG: ATP-binding protein [Anaerolineae bacterium]|jgi:signal transduction histidine kinase/CheY-like chemotaxis protein